jgi:hypothetical protein
MPPPKSEKPTERQFRSVLSRLPDGSLIHATVRILTPEEQVKEDGYIREARKLFRKPDPEVKPPKE